MLLQQANTAKAEWMMGADDALDSGLVLLGFRLSVEGVFMDTADGYRLLLDSASCPSADCQIPLVGLQVSSCDLVPIGHGTHSLHSRDD